VTSANVRSLRSVTISSQKEAAELATFPRQLSTIEELRWFLDRADENSLRGIGAASSLPNLRSIIVHLPLSERTTLLPVTPSDLALLLDKKNALARRLTHLSVRAFLGYTRFDVPRPDLGAWLAFAKESLPEIEEMSFDLQLEWSLTVRRRRRTAAPGDGHWSLELRGQWYGEPTMQTLTPIFANVPQGTFTSVRVLPNSTPKIEALLAPTTMSHAE